MYRGMGDADYAGSSWCGLGNPFVDFFCSDSAKKPTVEQIITDPSNYGSQLSEENRRRAEQMARDLVAGDNPCNYSEINSMGWAQKVACGFEDQLGLKGKDFTTPALIIGGVALFMLLKGH